MRLQVKVSTLYKLAVYFCIVWDTLLFSMFGLNVGGMRFSIFVAIAALLTLGVFSNYYVLQDIWTSLMWPNRYMAAVIIMLLVHGFYAIIIKGVSFGTFAHNAWYYLIVFFMYPLIYIFTEDGGTEQFWKTINIIMFIWYSWLLVQYFAYNFGGVILAQGGLVSFRGGSIRLSIRAIGHLLIIFNFNRFYNGTDSRNKKISLFMTAYGILIMLLIEQTRGYYIAIFGAIFVLLICNNKNANKIIISTVIIIAIVIFLYQNQTISTFLDTLLGTEGTGESGATGAVRLRGMAEFWNQFIRNPLLGYGFQESGDSVSTVNGIFYFNDDGFLGLIGQIGIWAFIIYGMMVVRFGYIVRKLFISRDYNRGTLLLGLYVYMLLTSISLICFWDSTCLVCPVLWALFEYEYNQHILEHVEQDDIVSV